MSSLVPAPDPFQPPLRPAPIDLRIGDRERDDACQQLTEHFAAGRLQQIDLDARLDLVMQATTRRELMRVLADLPRAAPPAPAFTPAPVAQWASPTCWPSSV